MPFYSLKVQTLVVRWKHFRSSSSAIFVDDAVPQWALYCVCGHKKNDGTGKFLGTRPTARIWHLRTFVSSPTWKKKTSPCQVIQITWWCQAWGANTTAWSGSHLLSTGFWEMDFPPRQVPQHRKWLCGKISEVKFNKWMKRHLTMWSYLVAIK